MMGLPGSMLSVYSLYVQDEWTGMGSRIQFLLARPEESRMGADMVNAKLAFKKRAAEWIEFCGTGGDTLH